MSDEPSTPASSGADDDRATGTPDDPVAPGEAQPGDRSELGANLGGPVDVFPGARRGGVDHPTPGGAAPASNRTGPGKQRD